MNKILENTIVVLLITILILITYILLLNHSISEQPLQTLYKILFIFILMSSDKLRPDLILKIVSSIMKP